MTTTVELSEARRNAMAKLENVLVAVKNMRNTAVWRAMFDLADALAPAISPLLTQQEAKELAESTKGLTEAFEKFGQEYVANLQDVQNGVLRVLNLYGDYMQKLITIASREEDMLIRLDKLLTFYEV